MVTRSFYNLLLPLLFYKGIIVAATTTIHFFTDTSCQDLYATVQTDTNAHDGQCGDFPIFIRGASSGGIDNGCYSIYHSRLDGLSSKVGLTMIPNSHHIFRAM